ncbi:MAG: electron transfer flavoprotein subunit beta [Candidatus Eisenbacteria bacterium]
MSIAQKVSFELVALDGAAGGFSDAYEIARALAEAIEGIPDLDRTRLLLFGGCASAARDAGVTMSMVAERLGLTEQFLGVDMLETDGDRLRIKERVEGGRYRISECDAPPAMLAWATGTLPIPPNNPQLGMQNMRSIMPALARAKSIPLGSGDVAFGAVERPVQRRETRVVKDMPPEDIAREIVAWMREG